MKLRLGLTTSKTNYYRQILQGKISAPEICEHSTMGKLPDGSLGEVLDPLWRYCKNEKCGKRKKVNRECDRPDCVRYGMKKTLKNFRRFLSLITQKKPEEGFAWYVEVGRKGFEPSTFRLSVERSTKLS